MTTRGEIAPIFVEDPKLPMTTARVRKILGVNARDLSDEQLEKLIWRVEELKEMFFYVLKSKQGKEVIMG